MKMFPLSRVPTAALLAAAGILLMAAQNPPQGPGGAPVSYLAPTNLKVLPRDMSGAQVHDVMEQWKMQLNVDCNACHANNKEKTAADGRPLLDFADDSKPEKAVARVMYTMTEEINARYIAKIDGSGMPVTCGTCHRGRIGPEPLTFPLDETKVQTQNCANATEVTKQQ